MPREIVLITGANGEIGHGLIEYLAKKGEQIIALDMQPLDGSLEKLCNCSFIGNILDEKLLEKLHNDFSVKTIYHLAALLSSRGEQDPELAHRVNVNGTVNLLKFAVEQTNKLKHPVKFIFPSSIAAYGMPDAESKEKAGKIKEDQFLEPITMYGCNKLYCENLGRYYMRHYRLTSSEPGQIHVDFRALRFPGLISALTVPTGGTTDYGPEMLHFAAQNKPYQCFVRPDTRLPFMVMTDAIRSMILLEAAPREKLTRVVYNVSSFSPTAEEIAQIVKGVFPGATISFDVNQKRQMIVDSWPADIDDSAARHDWNWAPEYDQKRAFEEYLAPAIRRRYQG
jgi:threonine 3-dehydrogenase